MKSAFFKQKCAIIDKKLLSLVKNKKSPHKIIYQAAQYSLMGGGKRFRPLLLLATLETLNNKSSYGIVPAAALECLHTYSLIHDDLPCMDDDDFRRGKPSLHKKYSEWLATLTGDFLLTLAFELLSTAPKLNAFQKVQLIQIFCKRAGAKGMLGGQVIDLLELSDLQLSDIKLLHLHKTADLLIAAVESACVIANLPKSKWKRWQNFATFFGLAYQIIDDIEDRNEDKKNNIVSILGEKRSKELAYNYLKKSLDLLPKNAPLLQSICNCKMRSLHIK